MNKKGSLRSSILIAAFFVVLAWLLKISEFVTGASLHDLAIYPRTIKGLIGIICAPLIHGSWSHIIGNTLPILLLGSMLAFGYPRARLPAIVTIWLLSGIAVWLFARSRFHLGASGVTHGMFFFLFVSGFIRRDKKSAILLMVAFYMYGGMLLTIFPSDPGVSFESHFFGAIAGAVSAYVFRSWDEKPKSKRYSWQKRPGEEEIFDEEDPVIGDLWKMNNEGGNSDSQQTIAKSLTE